MRQPVRRREDVRLVTGNGRFSDEQRAIYDVVLDAQAEYFIALRGTGDEIEVPIDHVQWARSYIDVNTQGPAVTRTTDVVAPGDVIYVRYIPEGWALSQPPEIQGALVSLDPKNGAAYAVLPGG